jgi:quinol monooxygenase YgiN
MAVDPVMVFASFEPKDGEEAAVERILRGMVAPTRSEPGNQIYDLFMAENDQGKQTFHLFEKYDDAEALAAHRETDHYKHYRATIADHLAGPIGVAVLKAVDARL